ncbi:MAG: polyprenol monophosphomannose synthase [Chloroflexota bacterium]|nr:MAG: polyprenol monophosphomannose synthase [Chloroflexota bacterium]
MTSLVVVPTYNERENLETLVAAILAAGPFHILVVDDGSPDGTGEIAERLKRDLTGRLDVIHRAGKLGLGTAYIAGFKYALTRDYSHVFEMDADFSHDPAVLPRLQAATDDADLALGSRYVPGGATPDWSLSRRVISRGGSIYARVILGLPIHDITGGFKCFRRESLAALDLDAIRSEGYSFQIELSYRIHQLGGRIREIPIVFMDRRVGQSKMSGRIVREAVIAVWRLRLTPPPRSARTGTRPLADRRLV